MDTHNHLGQPNVTLIYRQIYHYINDLMALKYLFILDYITEEKVNMFEVDCDKSFSCYDKSVYLIYICVIQPKIRPQVD